MAQKQIGPNFANEIRAAGLGGLPFAWDNAGNFVYGPDMTQDQINAVQAVYAAHNPDTPDPQATYNDKLAAGITITSTGNAGISATYALDDTTLSQISSVARDAASGLGLPQNASTFDYPDIDGNMGHAFSATDIQNLYKAMRDLVANLQEQLAVAKQGGTPAWPSQSVTIP